MIDFSAPTAVFRGLFGPERPFSGAAGGFRPSTHHFSPCQIEIGQSDQREHLRCVLRQSPVAHLRVAELAFDYAKQVLDARPNRRHPVIESLVRRGESQRGEGRLLHGGSAGYDLSILPALNRSELP